MRRAGTGMGEEKKHHVTEVRFDGNAGMFSVKEPPEPMPFIDEESDTLRFAPNMPE